MSENCICATYLASIYRDKLGHAEDRHNDTYIKNSNWDMGVVIGLF